MGFGFLLFGIPFLFDFQFSLISPESGAPHMILDLFPNFVGFALLFFGLRRLARKDPSFQRLTPLTALLFVTGVFVFLKDTVFFSRFYTVETDARGAYVVTESAAGLAIGFCQHLLIGAFLYFLFSRELALFSALGEEKLAKFSARLPQFVLCEAIAYAVSALLTDAVLPTLLKNAVKVLSALDMILWVFVIWYALIVNLRAAWGIPYEKDE